MFITNLYSTNYNGSLSTDNKNNKFRISIFTISDRSQSFLTPVQISLLRFKEEALVNSLSKENFVANYKKYKDVNCAKSKINEILDSKNNALIRDLVSKLNDKHFLLFLKEILNIRAFWNTEQDKFIAKFIKLCESQKLLNKLTDIERKEVLDYKFIIKESDRLSQLSNYSINSIRDFDNITYKTFLKATEDIKDNAALLKYLNKQHASSGFVIKSNTAKIQHNIISASIRNLVNKQNLSSLEKKQIIDSYKILESSIVQEELKKYDPKLYVALENKFDDIRYDQHFVSLNITDLDYQQKTSYFKTKKAFLSSRIVNGLIPNLNEFERIYELTTNSKTDIAKLSKKEQEQFIYIIGLRALNSCTVTLISQGKIDLANESIGAIHHFKEFASGAGLETWRQFQGFVCSQPVRIFITSAGCIMAPELVAVCHLGMFVYGIYSSYGMVKEDILDIVDSYQTGNSYKMGESLVRLASDAFVLKSIGKVVKSGYKLSRVRGNKNFVHALKAGVEAGHEKQKSKKLLEQVKQEHIRSLDKDSWNCIQCNQNKTKIGRKHKFNQKGVSLIHQEKIAYNKEFNNLATNGKPSNIASSLFSFKDVGHVVNIEFRCKTTLDGKQKLELAGCHFIHKNILNNKDFKLDIIEQDLNGCWKGDISFKNYYTKKNNSMFPLDSSEKDVFGWILESFSNPVDNINSKVEYFKSKTGYFKFDGWANINGKKTLVSSILDLNKKGFYIVTSYSDVGGENAKNRSDIL